MKRLARVFLLFALCVVVSGGRGRAQEPAGSDAPMLTLDDAVRIAQENNRTIKNPVLAASIAADGRRRRGLTGTLLSICTRWDRNG
jgi:hypothetical protein